jgi:hypothetical protein
MCLDYHSNVRARSFACTVGPLLVFEAWCLLRARFPQLTADTFLSIYSVFGGSPALLQQLIGHNEANGFVSDEHKKGELAEFMFRETGGSISIPCQDVLAGLGRQGKVEAGLRLSQRGHEKTNPATR